MPVRIDSTAMQKWLAGYRKQFPFAISKTLNELVTHFQRVERQHIRSAFILRRSSFVLNTVKIPRGGFATKTKLAAEVGIDPTRDGLAKFEEGGTKRPRGNSLAVPQAARRSPTAIVPKALRPGSLNLQRIPTRTGRPLFIGRQRTFLVETDGGERLLLQRTSRSRVRLLYSLVPSAHIDPDLRFEDNARTVARFRSHAFFADQMRKALQTAR